MSNHKFRAYIGDGALETSRGRVKPEHGQGPKVFTCWFYELLGHVAEGISYCHDLSHNRKNVGYDSMGSSNSDISCASTMAVV